MLIVVISVVWLWVVVNCIKGHPVLLVIDLRRTNIIIEDLWEIQVVLLDEYKCVVARVR
jgi:hypothetical protein